MTTTEPFVFQDEASETALVGCALVDQEIVARVSGMVRPEDFRNGELRRLWLAIEDKQRAGEAADVVTLSAIGFDSAWMTKLLDSVPTTAYAKDYATLVHEAAIRRNVVERATALAAAAIKGETNINEAIDRAIEGLQGVSLPGHGIVSSAEVASEVWDWLGKFQPGQSVSHVFTPWNELNSAIGGMVVPELVVIAGRPSMGKTQFAVQIAGYNESKGLKVLYHCLETSTTSTLLRLALQRSGVDWMAFRRGSQTNDDVAKLHEALASMMQGGNLHLIDRRTTIDEFRWLARGFSAKVGGLDLVICDYLQKYITPGRDKVNELGEVSTGLKEIAKELGCVVISTAQISRAVESQQDKRPDMSDLRGSGIIEQDADIVLGLSREGYYNPVTPDGSGVAEVIVLKARDGARGGVVNLGWNARTITFSGRILNEEYQRVMV